MALLVGPSVTGSRILCWKFAQTFPLFRLSRRWLDTGMGSPV